MENDISLLAIELSDLRNQQKVLAKRENELKEAIIKYFNENRDEFESVDKSNYKIVPSIGKKLRLTSVEKEPAIDWEKLKSVLGDNYLDCVILSATSLNMDKILKLIDLEIITKEEFLACLKEKASSLTVAFGDL